MGEWKATGCNMCGLCCNLEVYVENNHIVDVRPDADGQRNQIPYLCRKGRASRTLQDNPERLNYPLKRVGDRFERISWEQAYREIGERGREILDKYGPRSFAFVGGAQAHDQSQIATMQFMNMAIGSQYHYHPVGIEFEGSWWSNGRIIGHQGYMIEGDHDRAETFIYWGSNSYVSHNLMMSKGRETVRDYSEDDNKTLIVIDPRLSETARMADLHVALRPGTDALMARGLIALILDKGWEDKDYLSKWCADWPMARRWYDGFDYRKAFEVAEVPYEQMEDLARILTTTTWGVHQDLGIFFGRNNTIASFLIITLCAITGNLLTKGNITLEPIVPFAPPGDERDPDVWRTVETGKFPVCRSSYPTAVLAKEMLSEKEDRLRFVIVSASNPVVSFPDTPNLRKGFQNLDLMVAIEIVPTETTQYADYVLPGTTGFESYQFSAFTAERVFLKHPVLEPVCERQEDARILLNIGKALGVVGEVPEQLRKAAAKSVEKRDIIPFLLKSIAWFKAHPQYEKCMNLMMADALAGPEALGSLTRTMMRLGAVTSAIGPTKFSDRAGFKALKKYRFLNKLGPAKALADMSKMDQVFWAIDDTPHGAIIGVKDPDDEQYAYDHIFYPDHKIRLYDATIDKHIQYITPEAEAKALYEEMGDYPLLLSSGNHEDGGQNEVMRNPDSYKYRDPYTLLMNPVDAEHFNLKDGERVKLSTKRGSVEAPVEITYRAAKGYVMIPHHYGFEKDGKVFYGAKANDLTRGEDMDPITCNPYLRWVPCRIEKLR